MTVRSKRFRTGIARLKLLIPIVVVIASLVVLGLYGKPFMDVLGKNGLLGVFLLGLIGNAVIGFPPLVVDALVLEIATTNNLALTAVSYAAGAVGGEMVAYALGFWGIRIAHIENLSFYKRLSHFVHGREKLFAPIIFFTAAIWFPFDLVAAVAGSTRYPVTHFLALTFLGRLVRYLYTLSLGGWVLESVCKQISNSFCP